MLYICRDRVPEIEYIFHDTDKELPETYDYIGRLEAILGKPIVRTTPVDSFDHWLTVYRGMLPSNHRRWCTKMLKLKPFEAYVGDGPVINYVGLRADENRTGYISTKPNILAVYPFQDDGLVRVGYHAHLGRVRPGTAALHELGPLTIRMLLLLLSAKDRVGAASGDPSQLFRTGTSSMRKRPSRFGEQFFWCQNEPLRELAKPERVAKIKADWEKAQARKKANRKSLSLVETLGGLEVEDESHLRDGCLVCSI